MLPTNPIVTPVTIADPANGAADDLCAGGPAPVTTAGRSRPSVPVETLAQELREIFGVEFAVWTSERGELAARPREHSAGIELWQGPVLRSVASRGRPEFVGDEGGVVLLALPFPRTAWAGCVAVGPFITRDWSYSIATKSVARMLGRPVDAATRWLRSQTVWTPEALLRLSSVVTAKFVADTRARRLQHEVGRLSADLATTFDEINLLYGITQTLKIGNSNEATGRYALDRLSDRVLAQGVAIQLGEVDGEWLTAGACPVSSKEFRRLIEQLSPDPHGGATVIGKEVTGRSDWLLPCVRQLIVVPLAEGTHVYGWLAAFNHPQGEEFGASEATLLSSVGVLLGIHGGNRELYRQQAELLAGVVRALSSAIDAKDPYTCGHSDRVARIAVRLARELGYDGQQLNTVYMAGLLHDIGKIGVQESVLRKPGRLTDEEYAHIRSHPELGYRILRDIRQLAEILPAVLHHHEQWDGSGYPNRLAGEEIPRIARIMAVADAYDAMTSDRPYRNGLPEGDVERIFRDGAGQQWDAEVVAAYFRAREDIRRIATRDRGEWPDDFQEHAEDGPQRDGSRGSAARSDGAGRPR